MAHDKFFGASPLHEGSDLYITKGESTDLTFLIAEHQILKQIAPELRMNDQQFDSLKKRIKDGTIHVDVRKSKGAHMPHGPRTINKIYDTPSKGKSFRRFAKKQVYDSKSNVNPKLKPGAKASILKRGEGKYRIRVSDLKDDPDNKNLQTAKKSQAFYADATLNSCHIVGTDIWKIVTDNLSGKNFKQGHEEYIAELTAICFLGRQELHTRLSKNELNAKVSIVRADLLSNPKKALKDAMDTIYTDENMKPLKNMAYAIIDRVLV